MKRTLFAIATLLSLLFALAAAGAWVASHARPPAWRLVGVAHSGDLTRADRGRGRAHFTTTLNWPGGAHHGFWDAAWVLSRSGGLTILAQAVDYDGTLHRVIASPPSLVVEPSGGTGVTAAIFTRARDAGAPTTRLGFAWRSDAAGVNGPGGPVSVRGRMATVPYWLLVLLGAVLPLQWLRARRRPPG